jgi:hypothetical protein
MSSETAQAPAGAQPATAPRKYAWGVLLFFSVVIFLFGLGDLISGQSADPAIVESLTGIPWEELQASSPAEASFINFMVRAGGVHLLVMGLLCISVVLNGFRRGQRWAWYTMWVIPGWSLAVFFSFLLADRSPDFAAPPPMLSGPIFFAVTALVLLLSYRSFFPRA